MYWSFNFSISPYIEYSGLISFRIDRFILLAVQGTLKSLLQHQVQKHQFFSTQLSLWSNSPIRTWLPEKPSPWLGRPLSANNVSVLLSRFVITLSSKEQVFLISCLQQPSTVILKPKKKSLSPFPLSPHLFVMNLWNHMPWCSFQNVEF